MVSFLTTGHMILSDMCLKLPIYLMHSHMYLFEIPTDTSVSKVYFSLISHAAGEQNGETKDTF